MRHLRHSWIIALKDLRIFATDRTALFFFVAFPFMFIVLFNFILAGAGASDERLTLHVATQEAPDGLSHQVIQALVTGDTAQLKPGEPIIRSVDYGQAGQDVQDGKLAGFLAFPAGFTQSLFTGGSSQLEVIADAEATSTRAALKGLGEAIASEVGARRVAAESAYALLSNNASIPKEQRDQIVQGLILQSELEQPFISFSIDTVGEVEAVSPSNYVIPGYLVMFVFFAAALAAESIVRERQNRTLERLLTTSVKKESIVGGIFLGTAAKGLIQIIIFWVVGILVFHVDVGISPLGVAVLSLLMVIMSSAFGLMLASLVRTVRSASSLAVLTSLLLAPLGGCWWPLFILPQWMQMLARITPHGWANAGFDKLLVFGAGFGAALPEMLALAGFAAAFGLVAVWRFRTSAV